MVAVRSDQTVITSHGGLASGSHSLLSIIQVAETTDLALLVQLIGEDFHSAHSGYLFEEEAELILGHGGLRWQLIGIKVVGADDGRLQQT